MKTAKARNRIAFISALALHVALAGGLVLGFGSDSPNQQVTLEIHDVELVDGNAPAKAVKTAAPTTAAAQAAMDQKLTRAKANREPPPRTTVSPRSEKTVPSLTKGESPTIGTAIGRPSQSAVSSYLGSVRDRLSRSMRFRSLGFARSVGAVLKLTLEQNGSVKSFSLKQSSGSPDFDRSITDAIARAQPFPPFTPEMGSLTEITLSIPIQLRVR